MESSWSRGTALSSAKKISHLEKWIMSSGPLDGPSKAAARVLGREPPETAILKASWRARPAVWACTMYWRRVVARISTVGNAKRLGCEPTIFAMF